MNVKLLKNDGRCKWLENIFLNKLVPMMQESKAEGGNRKIVLIEDWVSNDGGKVGLDLKWLASLNIEVVKTYKDIKDTNYVVVNSGYDSIVDEEMKLREMGVEILDNPCPFVRKVRDAFMKVDSNYQYVLLCEPNHIIVKNFKSIFPEEMILVQMENYREKIEQQQNGKPLCLVPYVTFLPKQVEELNNFIMETYKDRENKFINTSCMWVASKISPIVEIAGLTDEFIEGIRDALIITTPGSVNKSLRSLSLALDDRGLNVVVISSLEMYLDYEKEHEGDTVLLVRSPIPNNAEAPIMQYVNENGKVVV